MGIEVSVLNFKQCVIAGALIFSSVVGNVYAQHSIKLIQTFPSNPEAFTQGFERFNGHKHKLLLATGLYGESKIGVLHLKTGRYSVKARLPATFFGEGVTQTPYGIWQLTWRENTAFLRQPNNFKIKKTVQYEGEGWGLAYQPSSNTLYMSNGTAQLQQRNAETFELISSVEVHDRGIPIDQLNELEYANGAIYANIWHTNLIAKINPQTGEVITFYDVSELLKQANISTEQRQMMDVLNGIAHIEGNRFYLTGKFYPVVFEVELH